MILHCITVVALLLALACSARGREFDAEADLGLVAGIPSPAVAKANTERLTAALAAQWPGGQFKFANGHVGPVLHPIRCAAKPFYFAGTIETSNRVGGCLYGGGGRSYMMLTDHPTLTGMVTTFIGIGPADGGNGQPVIRFRGAGFILDGIALWGRQWRGGANFTGARPTACIEVEGRRDPATGCHTIRNCLLAEAKYGIRALAGYYDEAGKFTSDENHADQTTVEGVKFSGVESCFRSENQQAVGWSFRDIHCDADATSDGIVVFDIVRGGNVAASNVMLNHGRVTLFKVQDYSHNNQRLSCEDFRFDGGYGPAAYLTLFEYAGPVYVDDDMSWLKWTVRVTGHTPNFDGTTGQPQPTYDTAKLIVIPDDAARVGVNRGDLLFDVARLPRKNFEAVGDGPWWRPK